jgi:hypothetical protein
VGRGVGGGGRPGRRVAPSGPLPRGRDDAGYLGPLGWCRVAATYVYRLDRFRSLRTHTCPATFSLAVGAVNRPRLTAPVAQVKFAAATGGGVTSDVGLDTVAIQARIGLRLPAPAEDLGCAFSRSVAVFAMARATPRALRGPGSWLPARPRGRRRRRRGRSRPRAARRPRPRPRPTACRRSTSRASLRAPAISGRGRVRMRSGCAAVGAVGEQYVRLYVDVRQRGAVARPPAPLASTMSVCTSMCVS